MASWLCSLAPVIFKSETSSCLRAWTQLTRPLNQPFGRARSEFEITSHQLYWRIRKLDDDVLETALSSSRRNLCFHLVSSSSGSRCRYGPLDAQVTRQKRRIVQPYGSRQRFEPGSEPRTAHRLSFYKVMSKPYCIETKRKIRS
jgi:hypothetical protein